MHKKFFPLIKISAKKSFQKLQKESPFYCAALDAEVFITKLFFEHIAFAKKRKLEDLVERLIMIPFIEEAFEEGELIKKTEKKNETFFKLCLEIKNRKFNIIVVKNQKRCFLLSCFLSTKK